MDDVAAAEPQHDGDRHRRQEEQSGQEVALDPRLAQDAVAHGARLDAEARAHVVLAAERLHHLDSDDRLVRGLGHVRLELLHEARDRHHLLRERPTSSRPTSGIASSATSASFALTSTSTTATPMIIISDCAPCTIPQPMK